MPNSHPKNAGKPWTVNQIAQLKRLVKQNTPTRVAAIQFDNEPNPVAFPSVWSFVLERILPHPAH